MWWVMLESLVTGLLNISVQAAVIFCVLFLARAVFSLCRIPKKYACFLWMILFARLLMPMQPESPVGLWIKGGMPQSFVENSRAGRGNAFVPGEWKGVTDGNMSGGSRTPQLGTSDIGILERLWKTEAANGAGELPGAARRILFLVWGTGCLGFLLYGGVSCLLLKKKLLCSIRREDNCYLVDGIPTAFVMGVFPPRIYVPSELEGEDLDYVILHERTHIKRMDYLVKTAAYLITCIYWFHPFVWAALVLMSKDIELSCDEAVLGRLGECSRREYANTLLRLSGGKRYFAGVPLAFGEGDTENRIRHIIRYRKPVAAAVAIAVILLSGLAVVLLTGRPEKQPDALNTNAVRSETSIAQPSVTQGNDKSIGENSYDSVNSRFPEPVELPSGHTVTVTGDVYHIMISIDGEEYRMADLCDSVNALMEIREFAEYIVVDGHVSPNASYYGFYSTESKHWVRAYTGALLTWDENWQTREDPIESVIYAEPFDDQGVIYDWEGNRIAVLGLEEEYIYGLKRVGDDITVTIVDYAGKSRELQFDFKDSLRTLYHG